MAQTKMTGRFDIHGIEIGEGDTVDTRTSAECRYTGVPDMYKHKGGKVWYDNTTCSFMIRLDKEGYSVPFLPSCEYEIIDDEQITFF